MLSSCIRCFHAIEKYLRWLNKSSRFHHYRFNALRQSNSIDYFEDQFFNYHLNLHGFLDVLDIRVMLIKGTIRQMRHEKCQGRYHVSHDDSLTQSMRGSDPNNCMVQARKAERQLCGLFWRWYCPASALVWKLQAEQSCRAIDNPAVVRWRQLSKVTAGQSEDRLALNENTAFLHLLESIDHG